MQVDTIETIYLVSNNSVQNYSNVLTHFINDLPGHHSVDPQKYDVSCFGVGLSLELPYILGNVDDKSPSFAILHPRPLKFWKNAGGHHNDIFTYIKPQFMFHISNNQQSIHSIAQGLNLFLKKNHVTPITVFYLENRLIIRNSKKKKIHAIVQKEFFIQLGLQIVYDRLEAYSFEYHNRTYYHVVFGSKAVYKGKRLTNINPDFHPGVINVSCKQIKPYQSGNSICQTLVSFPVAEENFKNYCTYEPRHPDKFCLNTESLTSLEIEVLDEKQQRLPISSGSPTIVKLQLTPRNMNTTTHNIRVSSKHRLFPKNTANDFYFKLNLPLNVSPNSQIILKQLIYPSRICNITDEFSRLLFYVHLHEDAYNTIGNIANEHPLFRDHFERYGRKQEIDKKFCFVVERNCYSTSDELLIFLNNHYWLRNLFNFEYRNGTCVISNKKMCTFYIPKEFQNIFGLGPDEYLDIVSIDEIDEGHETYTKAFVAKDERDRFARSAEDYSGFSPHTRKKREIDLTKKNKFIKLNFQNTFDEIDVSKNQLILPEPMIINKYLPTNVFLYCDIVRPTAVGNFEAQVLKCFTPIPTSNKYSQIDFDFHENKLLNTTLIDLIHFKLRTDYGHPVDFLKSDDEIMLSITIVENLDK